MCVCVRVVVVFVGQSLLRSVTNEGLFILYCVASQQGGAAPGAWQWCE